MTIKEIKDEIAQVTDVKTLNDLAKFCTAVADVRHTSARLNGEYEICFRRRLSSSKLDFGIIVPND